MRHGTVDPQRAVEIAEATLEQAKAEQAKAVSFRRTTTINAQDKKPIKELVETVSPLFPEKWSLIMLEFGLTALGAHLGRTPDEWGTLTLVALTEHLKEKTGRPHYALAIRTLKALRGKQLGSKRADTANGKSRVIQFKRRHKNWRDLAKRS